MKRASNSASNPEPWRIERIPHSPRSKRQSVKRGLPPGSLVHIGAAPEEEPRISLVEYSAGEIREKDGATIQDLQDARRGPSNSWIRVTGLHQVDLIQAVGTCFNIHPLALEDILNTNQRPKVYDYTDSLFIVMRVMSYHEDSNEIGAEQISLVLGANFLISFQETGSDLFKPIRERMDVPNSRIRSSGVDYLAYCLVDIIVDNYFVILEKLAERVELLEDELVTNPTPKMLRSIHRLKKDLILLRRSIWPTREVLNRLMGGKSSLMTESTEIYLRDVFDHTIHAVDTLETFRDIVSGMLDIYLSSVSYKLNEIMKVLTIIATVFIPLTFLVGWYGMNFKYMPELGWKWGYPAVIGVTVSIVSAMIIFFRRRKWI